MNMLIMSIFLLLLEYILIYYFLFTEIGVIIT